MIKPIGISPINTTNRAYFECKSCGTKNTLVFKNRIINTDNEGDVEDLDEEPCPNCGKKLGKN